MRQLFLPLFLVISLSMHAQEKTVKGNVTDGKTGNPLVSCTIAVKGAKMGTTSNVAGEYTLRIPYKQQTLVFSCVGFETRELNLGPTDSLPATIELFARTKSEDEVVVVGYAAQIKKQVVYASSATVSSSVVLRGVVSGKTIRSGKKIKYRQTEQISTSSYKKITENKYIPTACEPVSTFAADIDRASYSNVRRYLHKKNMPPADAIRIEEMINYFDYDYPAPAGKTPYAIYTELTECPWNTQHQLMRVALKCKTETRTTSVAANLVFLVDVSGSMSGADRLGLVQQSFQLLLDSLAPTDMVSIVTYAGAAGLALEPTPVSNRKKIEEALNRLTAGGSTAGGAGIELAYKKAREQFIEGGNNRVILATDGDFNVGLSSENDLTALIEKEKEDGIFLTCLGFGEGNYKDDVMEALADKGNGNYYYIDQLSEAKRVMQKEFRGTLNTVAKDVKLQAEFNPAFVQAYRLIGYENRLLNKEDFDNDAKDAGELGEGHSLTALYEIIPVGVAMGAADSLTTMNTKKCNKNLFSPESGELAAIRTRYKLPGGLKSRRNDFFVLNQVVPFTEASRSTRFAAAVAMFGQLARQSAYAGTANITRVMEIAGKAAKDEYDKEFLELAETFGKMK